MTRETRTTPREADDKEIEQHHILHKWSVQDEYRPTYVRSAQGNYFEDDDGHEYLDAFGQSWYSAAGHGVQSIIEAITTEATNLATVHAAQFPTPPRRKLARKLLSLLPDSFTRIFFGSNGSDAVELSLKLARRGTGRQGVIAFDNSYHGASMAATSVSGLPAVREGFGEPVPGTRFVPYPNCYRCPFQLTYPSCAMACAERVAEEIEAAGPENIAAIIAEPVSAVGGISVPPQPFWRRIQEIAETYDVWYISDEIVTGFGRTGHWFALDYYGVEPDIVTLGKSLTSGYMPLSAAVLGPKPNQAVRSIPLMHGMSFEGHSISCAAALANIEYLEAQELVDSARHLEAHLRDMLGALKSAHPCIGDIRGLGAIWGIELVADRNTKKSFTPGTPFISMTGESIDPATWAQGRLLHEHRVHTGAARNIIQICPPLTFATDEISALRSALDAVLTEIDQYCATPRRNP